MANLTGGLWGLAQAVVILLIGTALVGGGWSFHQDAQQATENAIEVDGRVVSSVVTEVRVEDEDGSHIEYAPEIEYRYTYEGTTYTSTSICPGTAEGCEASNAKSREDVEEFLSRYPEGETVTVYVLPDEPARAFLVETDSGSIAYYILMGIGAIAVLGGLGAVAGSLKKLASG